MNAFSGDSMDPNAEGDLIAGDRRSDRRYDINLELRWKLIRRRRILDTGAGTTLDLSSGGILFETDRQLPSGSNVELAISWPVLLHNVAPMQLVVTGRIVRTAGGRTAIRMTQHEFRTVRMVTDKSSAAAAGMRAADALFRNADPGKVH